MQLDRPATVIIVVSRKESPSAMDWLAETLMANRRPPSSITVRKIGGRRFDGMIASRSMKQMAGKRPR